MGRKAATIVALGVVLCSCSLAWAEDEHAIDDGLYGQIEAHLSILSDVADRSILGDTVGYGARIGYRWGDWGIPFQIEHNLWFTEEFERGISTGAINIGTGFEYLYFDKRVRLSPAAEGGQLQFMGADGAEVVDSLSPGFDTLDMFCIYPLLRIASRCCANR